MKNTLFLLSIIILFFSCKNSEQVNLKSKSKKESIIKKKQINSEKTTEFTVFEIDSIPDIKAKNERSPSFIKRRLGKLIGRSMKEKCENLGVNYPPQFVLFITFKLEAEFEIWIGNSRSDSLKRLAILPICAVDNTPGTKLQSGDGKTPEGFYNCDLLYGSSYSFMWMKLNVSEIDEWGEVRKGSSFKICSDYPHSIDRLRTRKIVGKVSPGGEICIHPNCVTAGCISFKNRNFLPVFLAASYHNKARFGKIKVYTFPFRFTEELKTEYSKNEDSEMTAEQLITFWNKIEVGYNLFEKKHKALRISYSGNKYIFKTY